MLMAADLVPVIVGLKVTLKVVVPPPAAILLEGVWSRLLDKGIDRDLLIARGQISPATCCLINPDREKTVEMAFRIVKGLSERMREKYRIQ